MSSGPPSYIQEVAPSKGFPPINYKRVTPQWGPSGRSWWLIGIGAATVGLIGTVINNRNLRSIKREEIRAKMILTPLLQAHEDARYLSDRAVLLAREAVITADDPNWEVGASVYHFPDLATP